MRVDAQKIKDTILNFLVPLVAILLSGVMFFVFIYPYFKSHKDLLADLEAKKTLRNQLSDKMQVLNDLLDFKDVILENSTLVADVLPGESDVPQLLTQIDTIARESGLHVDKLSYSMRKSPGDAETVGLSEIAVQFAVSGGRNQFITFLEVLENSARLVNVDTFRFVVDAELNEISATAVLTSPYLFVESSAVTDDPISLDITSQDFLDLIDAVKKFKVYRSEVTIEIPEETEEIELVEELEEVEVPEEGGVPAEVIEAIEATGESPEL